MTKKQRKEIKIISYIEDGKDRVKILIRGVDITDMIEQYNIISVNADPALCRVSLDLIAYVTYGGEIGE